jgi:N-ethylmaleimide reductase
MTTNLFSPLKLGRLQLPNRVIYSPMTRGRAGKSRVPNDYMRQYYEARASAGLIISEATAISEQGYGWFGSPGIYTEEHSKQWKNIVDAVHNRGGRMFLQLWHQGRTSHTSYHKNAEIVGPSAIAVPKGKVRDANNHETSYQVPRALKTEEVPKIVQDYKKSAELAMKAGFDGVEVHSANGYLIDQFLQSVSNQRTDEYGGNLENRFCFLKEILAAVSQVYNPNQIGIRLSPNGVYNGMGSDDNDQLFPFIAKQVAPLGLAYLHVMDGVFGGGVNEKCSLVRLIDMKKQFPGPIIGNTGYTKELANGAIRTGAVDAISFARPYIANVDLVERFKNDWPLNDPPEMKHFYAIDGDPSKCLEGYLGYKPYEGERK